ncbi:TPA: UDP-glucose 4-epimerase GalE [Neisseria meningitidis]|uniref:UDP-glucose 4-epimerase n=3 Tax=Neisseria meningitidis TaxID=487 RepID=M5D9M7_NEIME|nr:MULTISPECIES: UDP-glucose 4-epimerase GalE [Neisseria]CBA03566.1 UDP-glucose 4-epimerase [Neisseria meningitidis alpha153]EJU75593.1 UDP-glucose 4-epimerase [Neisseria meningitidis NM2657]MBH2268392.1 UDP-glucose 4-epimerase GalE [Neisseria meningitidis]MBH2283381.1 UDP-glucose 4-epimerase GalE [Neisseria meningitidis]MBH2355903.1 UDP-glucose 4-epimerase GalE [Neisseria meningitidis]
MKVLVTGGTGFIGSHTAISLIKAGYDVVILDNLCNSSINILPRLKEITGKDITFYQGDIRDRALLQKIFAEHKIETVMHFAGLKAVGESNVLPMKYYDYNVSGSLILAEEMAKAGVFSIVFSSSATVYGDPARTPITEDMPVGGTTNPYGTSKYMVERILSDIQKSDSRWSVILLRYFNPVGAHESGLIGEYPNGIPNNLLPYICQVASGKLPYLSVFGDDYPTPDGTGVRDYIHVVDLADGHLKAMQAKAKESGVHIYNLGTGNGYSVLDMVKAFEAASGLDIPYQIKPRRDGDIAVCFADPAFTESQIGWKAQFGLSQMMEDSWRWVSNNPNGYDD